VGTLSPIAWGVLRLRVKERPPDVGVVANVLSKHSRTADTARSFILAVGRGASNASP
jgi:hypothetical protein